MQHITRQSLGQLAGQLFQKYSYLHEASMQSIKLLLMLETSQITKVAKSLICFQIFDQTRPLYPDESKYRSSHAEVFLRKGVLKICSKLIGERLCRSAISIKLQNNFIEITLRHGYSPVNLLHIFKTSFPGNNSCRQFNEMQKSCYWIF